MILQEGKFSGTEVSWLWIDEHVTTMRWNAAFSFETFCRLITYEISVLRRHWCRSAYVKSTCSQSIPMKRKEKWRIEWCLWDGATQHRRFNKAPCNTVHFSIHLISVQAHKYQVADLDTNVLMNYRHFPLTRFTSHFCVPLLWTLCYCVFYARGKMCLFASSFLFFLCVGGKNECLQKWKCDLPWILLISVEQMMHHRVQIQKGNCIK